MGKHIGHGNLGGQRHGQTLQLQSQGTDSDNLRIFFSEGGDNGLCHKKDSHAGKNQHDKADLQTETVSLCHSLVVLGAIGIAANRLKALSKADNQGKDEHTDTHHDGHGCDSRISVRMGGKVQ